MSEVVENAASESSASAPAPEPAAAPQPAIRVQHLYQQYGAYSVLHDVSFEVWPGEIFGFIGPNGAGKTTTIRVMATLLEPTAGRVEISGLDVTLHPDAIRRLIGYMPDHAGVYERITVREYLEFFAAAYRVPELGVVDAVLELTELGKLHDRLVASLSKGMKQRLQIARILLHDPQVLILDEPASDLDPRARIEIRDLLLELRELGKTIFLSSHILTELSDVCTSVGILERGRLLVSGPIGEIAERLRAQAAGAAAAASPEAPAGHPGAEPPGGPAAAVGITPGGAVVPGSARKRLRLRLLADSRAVAPLIAGGSGILGVEPGPGGLLTIYYVGDDQFVAAVVRHLVHHQIGVVGVEPERNELERIFLEVTRGDLS